MMAQTIPAKRQSFFSKWAVLMVLSLALMIIVIDTTVLNVSLRTIILDLHTTIQNLQWVIAAYSLTLAALTVTGGRLGDLFGRKRMFVIGAVIFALGSLLASLSHNVSTLLIGESVIEGIGAALMMPATASLLMTHYSGRDRAVAFGVWGGIAAAALAIGPILGGFLTTQFSWRWAFRINVIIALILMLGATIIKEAQDKEEEASLDFVGVVLSALGLLGIVYGVIQSSTYGWLRAKESFAVFGHPMFSSISVSLLALIFGFLVLGVFVWWQNHLTQKGKTPLVSLRLFQNAQFTSGVITTTALALGQVGLIFMLPIFFQAVRGLDALHTGYALLPMTLTLLIAAPASASFSKKLSPKRIIQLGLVCNIVGVILVRWRLNVLAGPWQLAPGLLVYGAGTGMVIAQITNLTLSAVSVQEAGEASGVNNTLRQVGSSLGSAIMGAVLITGLSTNIMHGITNSAVVPGLLKSDIATTVSNQQSNVEFGGTVKFDKIIPPDVKQEIVRISHQSTVSATKNALIYMIGFIFLTLLVSTKLPNVHNVERNQSAASGH